MRDNNYVYSDCGTFRGEVSVDIYSMDPREWDNFGRMVCFHGKYKLGDSHDFNENDYQKWDEVQQAIKDAGGVLILPLGIYDHGGITMYIGKSRDDWDSGQVGFIYVTQEDMDREGVTIEKAEAILRNEVKVYDAYLTGNVYRWDLEQKVPSCSCKECEHWESVESNGEYIDHLEAERAMKEELSKYSAVSA